MPTLDRGLAVLLTSLTGALIAMQAPINAGLGKETGGLPAALISFLVGTILLAAIVVLAGQADGLSSAFKAGPIYLIGGLLGAAYVFTAIKTVGTIGAGGVAAATITGQLTASVMLDRAGFLGLEQQALTPTRLAGIALLLSGTILIVR